MQSVLKVPNNCYEVPLQTQQTPRIRNLKVDAYAKENLSILQYILSRGIVDLFNNFFLAILH